MPLIRKPYEQGQAESDFKSAGQAELGSGQYSQDTGLLEPSKNTYGNGRLPGGFVNTDRLVNANRELIDVAGKNIKQIGTDIGSQGSSLRGRLSGSTGGFSDNTPGELSVDEILDFAGKSPDELKSKFGWSAKNPDDVVFDEKSYDPLLKRIADTTGATGLNPYVPDPFKYGLLKSGGALNDNTLPGYADQIKKDRADIATETAKYNELGDKLSSDATTKYRDKFSGKLRGILDEALPQLNNTRPYASINIGGKARTDVMGGSDEERSGLVNSLRTIGGLIGVDPNTINAAAIDREYFKKQQEAIKRRENQGMAATDDEHPSGYGNQARIHSQRAQDSAMEHANDFNDYSARGSGFGGSVNGMYQTGNENDPRTNRDLIDAIGKYLNY